MRWPQVKFSILPTLKIDGCSHFFGLSTCVFLFLFVGCFQNFELRQPKVDFSQFFGLSAYHFLTLFFDIFFGLAAAVGPKVGPYADLRF